ncbi:glutathione S-transferase N-terminal domain-containing protein [Alkalicella caledoniensis]|uniref:Glutathione S-transferase N-terminal domain-containing protein n=1 Tax=Alkalicella caledoniensis TaxID=2731377 RepID=A0A7G9WD46_ALKCA|nr:glutathione S-transferase N-terminal domain-containing protein [Alkalicella caledoniensis]QNO16608.1 glutathione S-transferase N-terminal domain-containing protein [Alkalicella caledoniensis]
MRIRYTKIEVITIKDIKLYVMQGCPFCNKVEKYVKENNLSVELVDIKADPKYEDELVRLGGKDQVPMLLVDGKPLYESDDIIEWFKEKL